MSVLLLGFAALQLHIIDECVPHNLDAHLVLYACECAEFVLLATGSILVGVWVLLSSIFSWTS